MLFTRYVLSVLLLLGSAVPSFALKIDYSEFTLGNGMKVVVVPDHRAPLVTQMVWYKVGGADEEQGKTGLAHFLEHLMFKGTQKHPPGEFDRLLRTRGGEGNAFTNNDNTVYYQMIAADRLPLIMELEADRMQNLKLNDEIVLPEREVVREERRLRTENDPSSLLAEQVQAALYSSHPYGRPVVGWMSDVARLTKDDALNFYHSHYEPRNAVLVVAGDVTTEQVKKLAERYYGPLRNITASTPMWRTPEVEPLAPRRVDMRDPRVTSQSWQRVYLVPTYSTADLRVVKSLGLLRDILGQGTQSLLYKSLVLDKKLAAYVGAEYLTSNNDSGQFTVYAIPASGHSMEEIEAAVDGVLSDVLLKGVTQAQLDQARRRSLASDVYQLDNTTQIAQQVGYAVSAGIKIETLLDSADEISKVTVADVNAAAKKWLNINASVTATLQPPKQMPEAALAATP